MPDLMTKRVPIAKGGVNKRVDAASMKGLYTPYMKNMLLENGKLRKFGGYEACPSSTKNVLKPIGSSVEGRSLFNFTTGDGNSRLFAATETQIFRGVISGGILTAWSAVTPGITISVLNAGWTDSHADLVLDHFALSDRILSTAVLRVQALGAVSDDLKIGYGNAATADLTGYTHVRGWIRRGSNALGGPLKLVISESAAGAKSGDYVEIEIPDPGVANEWRFFSIAVDLSSINAAASIGLWNNSSINWVNGDVVYLSYLQVETPLSTTGAFTNEIRTTKVTDMDMFGRGGSAVILTNQTDDLLYWDNPDTGPDTFKTLVHTFSDFVTCKDIVEFWNYFMILNYTLSTGNLARMIEHSGAGNVNDHVSSSSGSYNLTDLIGSIRRVFKIGQSLIIFSDRTVAQGNYLGSVTKFMFNNITGNLGLYYSNAADLANNVLFFIGSNKRFYVLLPGAVPVEIGANVSKALMDLSTTLKDAIVFYNSDLHRVFFGKNQGGLFKAYSYNLIEEEKPWEYFEFTNQVKSHLTADMSYYNDQQTALFIDYDCEVFRISDLKNSNPFQMDDTDITCEYQTEDISINDEFEFARWEEFTFTAKSSVASASVVVEYSIDNGSTWKAADESPIYLENNEWKTYLVHFDVVSRVIRLRFTQTAKDLQIKDDMFISYIPELGEGKEIEVK